MDQRDFALSSALELARVNGGMATANAPHSAQEVAGNAVVFLSFLEGTYKNVLAGTAVPEGTPPKATRQRKAASTATEQENAQSDTVTSATEAAASTAKSDDMFGEDEKPAETKKAKTKKEVKKTLDDVRAALVAAQTALKSKDKAVALLTEVAGAAFLSKLKEEDFGKLIDNCNAAVKAAA